MKRIFIMLIVAMLSFSVDAQNLSSKEVSKALLRFAKAILRISMKRRKNSLMKKMAINIVI
jgi:hypothetical protein